MKRLENGEEDTSDLGFQKRRKLLIKDLGNLAALPRVELEDRARGPLVYDKSSGQLLKPLPNTRS